MNPQASLIDTTENLLATMKSGQPTDQKLLELVCATPHLNPAHIASTLDESVNHSLVPEDSFISSN